MLCSCPIAPVLTSLIDSSTQLRKLMTNIIFVTSEKGGQGKSVVCKCLADYAIRHNKPISIFDTDSTNPDVYQAYPERAQQALFSESEALQDYANSIIEAAVDADVVVNCRASVFLTMRHWFENNNILELAAEENMKFIMAFVTDGEPESLGMLKENLKYFRDRVRHVVLRNLGTARVKDMQVVWRTFDEDLDLQNLIKEYNATVLDFPAMYGNAEMLTIKEKHLSFWKASQSSEFKLIPRKRIETFIFQAFKAITQGSFFSIPSGLSGMPAATPPASTTDSMASKPANSFAAKSLSAMNTATASTLPSTSSTQSSKLPSTPSTSLPSSSSPSRLPSSFTSSTSSSTDKSSSQS